MQELVVCSPLPFDHPCIPSLACIHSLPCLYFPFHIMILNQTSLSIILVYHLCVCVCHCWNSNDRNNRLNSCRTDRNRERANEEQRVTRTDSIKRRVALCTYSETQLSVHVDIYEFHQLYYLTLGDAGIHGVLRKARKSAPVISFRRDL